MMGVELFLQSGTDYSIIDGDGRKWTIDEAKTAWDTGCVVNYNLAFRRLVDVGWSIEKLKAHYAGGGR